LTALHLGRTLHHIDITMVGAVPLQRQAPDVDGEEQRFPPGARTGPVGHV